MPVIALTGATGFVGQHTLASLLAADPEIRIKALVRNPDRRRLPGALSGALRDGRAEVVAGDLADHRALARLTADATTLVHIAAAIAGNRADDFERANVLGTRALLNALNRHAPDAHLILISSLAARRPNLSWYAASKRAAEELVATRANRWSILRPPAVYGPEDPALADFWRWLARGWLIRLGPPNARFSLLHGADLARAIVELNRVGSTEGMFEPSGPQPSGGWRWSDIAELAARLRGAPVRRVAVPRSLLASLGAAAPWWGRLRRRPAMLSPGKIRELQHHDWVCDNVGLSRATGWNPAIALETALPDLPGWRRP